MLEKQSPSPQCQDFRSSWKAFEHAQNLTKKGGGAYQAGVKEAGRLHPKQHVVQCGRGSGLVMESCECKALSWYLFF